MNDDWTVHHASGEPDPELKEHEYYKSGEEGQELVMICRFARDRPDLRLWERISKMEYLQIKQKQKRRKYE